MICSWHWAAGQDQLVAAAFYDNYESTYFHFTVSKHVDPLIDKIKYLVLALGTWHSPDRAKPPV